MTPLRATAGRRLHPACGAGTAWSSTDCGDATAHGMADGSSATTTVRNAATSWPYTDCCDATHGAPLTETTSKAVLITVTP